MKKRTLFLLLGFALLLFLFPDARAGSRPEAVFFQPYPEYDWSAAKEIFPGIRYAEYKTEDPMRIRFFLMRIDLAGSGVQFDMTPPDPDYGKPMQVDPKRIIHTKRQTTPDYMAEQRAAGKNMIAAINLSPWSSSFDDPKAWLNGFAVYEGKPLDTQIRNAFFIYKDGHLEIRSSRKDEKYEEIRYAAFGFDIVLEDGLVLGDGKARHPRTALGLSQDGKILYILICDGRRPWSIGFTERELGHWLKVMGAWTGINMDGGGSTTLCLFLKGKIRVMNTPSDGRPRLVANNLGILLPASPR